MRYLFYHISCFRFSLNFFHPSICNLFIRIVPAVTMTNVFISILRIYNFCISRKSHDNSHIFCLFLLISFIITCFLDDICIPNIMHLLFFFKYFWQWWLLIKTKSVTVANKINCRLEKLCFINLPSRKVWFPRNLALTILTTISYRTYTIKDVTILDRLHN